MPKGKGYGSRIRPGRVAERRMTEGVASGHYSVKVSPDGREIVYDPRKPKGKRYVGDLGKSGRGKTGR